MHHTAVPKQLFGGLIQRFFAWLVDKFIINIANQIILFAIAFITATNFSWAAFVFFQMSISTVYYICLHGKYGATLGKKLCKIKVVSLGLESIGYKSAALRYFPFIVVYMFILIILQSHVQQGTKEFFLFGGGWAIWFIICAICMKLNSYKRMPHDLLAKTVVIKV